MFDSALSPIGFRQSCDRLLAVQLLGVFSYFSFRSLNGVQFGIALTRTLVEKDSFQRKILHLEFGYYCFSSRLRADHVILGLDFADRS